MARQNILTTVGLALVLVHVTWALVRTNLEEKDDGRSRITAGLLRSMQRKPQLDIILYTAGQFYTDCFIKFLEEENVYHGEHWDYKLIAEFRTSGYIEVKNADAPLINYLDKLKGLNSISENEVFCTLEYKPVCAHDGKTYSNDCQRERAQDEEPTTNIGKKYDGACKIKRPCRDVKCRGA